MLTKPEIKKKINLYLSILKNYIELENAGGNYDINVHCEDFFCEFLNLVFDLDLINLNEIKVNFPAVDLGDKDSRVCYQVTTTSKSTKIKSTLEKFNDKKLYNDYDEINILILGDKLGYTFEVEYDEFEFEIDENILDFKDLYKIIFSIKNKSKLEKILEMLEENLIDINLTPKGSILDNYEKEVLKLGTSYEKFMKIGLKIDICKHLEEAEQIKKDIEYVANKLVRLDRKTREVMKIIIDEREIYDSKKREYGEIYFDGVGLSRKSEISIMEELRLLERKRFLVFSEYSWGRYKSEDEKENYDKLYCMSEDEEWDVLYPIVDYCYKSKIDIDKLILDLDFTILD